MKEVEIGRAVVEWLHAQEWEVYQEVQIGDWTSRIVDIVATRPYKSTSILWAIECKKSLSFSVAKQAWFCRGFANYASCAVGSKRSGGWPKEWLKRQGIGLVTVVHGDVTEEVPPFVNRNPLPRLRDALREEHKTWAEAGNANGTRYSPFQDTAWRVVRFVNEHPGCAMKDIMAGVSHHYNASATFRSCIPRYIREGAIKGIEIREGERGKNTFWPTEKDGRGAPAKIGG